MTMMNAVRIHRYGGPEVLRYEKAPRPEPGTGEVLIRVHGAGVNPVDWKVREGYARDFLKHALPLVPGWDVSGVVEAVGPGATRWKPGDELFSRPDIARNGAYAEFLVVRESEAARKPQSLDHLQAAAVPLAALTAWQALFDAAGLGPGQTVLIHAAAGGVGHFAVQLAKWKGARVIGTASAGNHAFLRTLGADDTIDYTTTRFEEVVRDADVVLDTMGGDTQQRSWKTLREGGILSTILAPPPEEAVPPEKRLGYTFVQPNAEQLSEIATLIDAGKIRTVVETVLPLPEAWYAQERSQAGHVRGKIVLQVR
jgi:NADPH:quinone reductase-like Zn-dependent oxidoreductase